MTCPKCASPAFVDGCCAVCGHGFKPRVKAKKKAKPVIIPTETEYREPWWSK